MAECGLGRGYLSELERGLVVPSLHALTRLAGALEVAVADLVLADTPRERLFTLLRDVPDADVEDNIADVERLRAELGLAQARTLPPTARPAPGGHQSMPTCPPPRAWM